MNRAVWLALLAVGAACGSSARTSVTAASDQAEYPCVLRDPITLRPDFMVRQTLEFAAVRNGTPVHTQLDVVLQKRGDTLLIIGLGPMNATAFTLQQNHDQIEFKQFMGPHVPFSPRNVVVDVHRVYFKRLEAPVPGGLDTYTGTRQGELDGEHVEEVWQNGQLRSIAFTRPAQPALRGAIRIAMGPGCRAKACEPETVSLENQWYGYRLTVINGVYQPL